MKPFAAHLARLGTRRSRCATQLQGGSVRAGFTQGASRRVRHTGCITRRGRVHTGCVTQGAPHRLHHTGCITHKGRVYTGCITQVTHVMWPGSRRVHYVLWLGSHRVHHTGCITHCGQVQIECVTQGASRTVVWFTQGASHRVQHALWPVSHRVYHVLRSGLHTVHHTGCSTHRGQFHTGLVHAGCITHCGLVHTGCVTHALRTCGCLCERLIRQCVVHCPSVLVNDVASQATTQNVARICLIHTLQKSVA